MINIACGAGTGIAGALILTSGAIQRSQAIFVNAGRMRKVCDPNLMPFIGQLPQYSGSPQFRGAAHPTVAGI